MIWKLIHWESLWGEERDTRPGVSGDTKTASIPYVKGVSERIRRILGRENVKTDQNTSGNLKKAGLGIKWEELCTKWKANHALLCTLGRAKDLGILGGGGQRSLFAGGARRTRPGHPSSTAGGCLLPILLLPMCSILVCLSVSFSTVRRQVVLGLPLFCESRGILPKILSDHLWASFS